MNKLIEELGTRRYSSEEIAAIIDDVSLSSDLFDRALDVSGEDVKVYALLEFSNYCRNRCLYCGCNRHNKKLKRCRMGIQEIVEAARSAQAIGYNTLMMQSGEDAYYTQEILGYIINEIKALGMEVYLSSGERPLDEYRFLKNQGLDGYLIRFEVFNPNLYRELHPEQSPNYRRRCIEVMKAMGLKVISGSLVGLPHQMTRHLAEDIAYIYKVGIESVGIGPFIPHPDTPLRNASRCKLETVLKMMALLRVMSPQKDIVSTSALNSLTPEGVKLGIMAGANVLMLNVTPDYVRSNYEVFPGKSQIDPGAECNLLETVEAIRLIGKNVVL